MFRFNVAVLVDKAVLFRDVRAIRVVRLDPLEVIGHPEVLSEEVHGEVNDLELAVGGEDPGQLEHALRHDLVVADVEFDEEARILNNVAQLRHVLVRQLRLRQRKLP